MWFQSPLHFRELNGVGRDKLEGVGSYEYENNLYQDVTDGRPIHPMFMMSFSETLDASKPFGNYYLILNEPEEFADLVRKKLPESITRVEWRKVEYTKNMSLDRHPDPVAGWVRKYYCKPEKFAQEREWRLCVSFIERLPILNHTLKLRMCKDVRKFFDYGTHEKAGAQLQRRELNLDDLRAILVACKEYQPNHHLGRPFMSSYQIAIRFAAQHPTHHLVQNLKVGGKGVQTFQSLTQRIAQFLSQEITRGAAGDIEAGFISHENIREFSFQHQEGSVEVSTLGSERGHSIYRVISPNSNSD